MRLKICISSILACVLGLLAALALAAQSDPPTAQTAQLPSSAAKEAAAKPVSISNGARILGGSKPLAPSAPMPASSRNDAPPTVSDVPAPNVGPTNERDSDGRAMLQATQAASWATIVMAIIGALQLLLFFWQLNLMRNTVGDAKASADAANEAAKAASLNAKAAVRIELPLLTASVFGLGRLRGPHDPYDPPGGTVNDGYPGQYSSIGPIMFSNSGRSPALPNLLELGWLVTSTDLPDRPRYTEKVLFEHFAQIRPEAEFQVAYHAVVKLSDEEQKLLSEKRARLWFFGSLHYRDFLDEHRETRFCFTYEHRPSGNRNPFAFYNDREAPIEYTKQNIAHAQ